MLLPRLIPYVTGCVMAAGRAAPSIRGGRVGDGHRFLAVAPFQPDQMELVAGMGCMTGKAGDFIPACMEIMKVLPLVSKTGRFPGLMLIYQ